MLMSVCRNARSLYLRSVTFALPVWRTSNPTELNLTSVACLSDQYKYIVFRVFSSCPSCFLSR
jgi:hypothetical protein